MVVTNGTLTNRFEELSKIPSRVAAKRYSSSSPSITWTTPHLPCGNLFENINRMRKTEISFTVEITPSDELIPHIGNIKELSSQKLGLSLM